VIIIDLIEALQKQMEFCREKERYKCGVYVKSQEHMKMVGKVISNLIPRVNKEVDLRLRNNYTEAIWTNGSVLKIIRANDSARAQRFNGIIIDNDIEREIINTIIYPVLRPIITEISKGYEKNDNPNERVYYVGISEDDVRKSEQYKQIFYVSSATRSSSVFCDDLIKPFTTTELFKKEYECMFYENDYDRPVIEKELNGDKVMLYEAWGIPKDLITYSTEFINKTKKTYLNVSGKYEIQDLGFKNDLNIHILIDTDIYDGYEVHVNDGLVMVVLHEIKNEAPALKDYGVSESEDNEAHFPID
jgi:hypothetical protein